MDKTFWDNQRGTNRNRCTQRRVILYAQTHWRTLIGHQKLGHPDLLYWDFSFLGHHKNTYMYIISATCCPAVTKFGSWVYLTWVQDLIFKVTEVKMNKSNFGRNRVVQIVTDVRRHL